MYNITQLLIGKLVKMNFFIFKFVIYKELHKYFKLTLKHSEFRLLQNNANIKKKHKYLNLIKKFEAAQNLRCAADEKSLPGL